MFNFSKKFRVKFVGRADDADSDSYSDSEFEGIDDQDMAEDATPLTEEEKMRMRHNHKELLEKRFERKLFQILDLN